MPPITEMGMVRDELNIGQLAKERFGDEARLIGFGTHTGTVAAASDWDAPMEVKKVRPSLPESYERLCHDSGVARFLLDLREGENRAAAAALMEPLLERFIGVIYRPETERWSHYSQAILPQPLTAGSGSTRPARSSRCRASQRPGEHASRARTRPGRRGSRSATERIARTDCSRSFVIKTCRKTRP